MRGKHFATADGSESKRITPAHAGKTYALDIVYKGVTDHPRACGENNFTKFAAVYKDGSPPRMRGKHFGNGVFPWLILVLSLNPL